MGSKIINKLSFYMIVITLSVVFNLLTQSSSEAGATGCAKNGADTAILVTPGDDKPFALAGTTTYDQDQCSQEPMYYKVKFFKVALCSSDPYKNTADPDFSSCTNIFNDTSGVEKVLRPDQDTNLLDDDLLLNVGTYPYLVVIVDNHLNIKHRQQYVLESDHSSGATILGNATGSGDWCWTIAAVTTYTNFIADGNGNNWPTSYNTAHGVTLLESGTGTTNARLKCGSSKPGLAAMAYATEIIDDLAENPDSEDFQASSGANYEGDPDGDTRLSGITMAQNLLQIDNTSIATTGNNARRLVSYFKYDDPVTITENTVGFKLRFNTYSSVSIDMAVDTGDGNKIYGAKMGADAFVIQVQTKTKRARGTWR